MSEVIVEVQNGSHYCEECLRDVRGPYDNDLGLFLQRRLDSGICGCCGAVVDAGEFVDTVR